MRRKRKPLGIGRFYLPMVIVLVLCFAAQGVSQGPAQNTVEPGPESEAAGLRIQLAKSEERVKTLDEHLQSGIKFSATLVSNYDYIFKSAVSIDRLADSLMGVTQQKNLDALLLAESAKITDLELRLKAISDGATQFSTKDSPEDLRKLLLMIPERTNKAGVLVRDVETITKMAPDQVVDKLRKDGLLPQPLQMIPPDAFDKSKQTISQAELDALIAENKVVKAVEFNELLKPDERQIASAKSEYMKTACKSLSRELNLLHAQLRDADVVLSSDMDATSTVLRDESTKMRSLKTELAKYPVEGGQTK
jgi:hypothetical protein